MRISDWSSDVCSSDLPLDLHLWTGFHQAFAQPLRIDRDAADPVRGYPPQVGLNQAVRDPLSVRLRHVMRLENPRREIAENVRWYDERPLSHIKIRLYRSEERRVGKECVRPFKSRWTPY